MTLEKWLDWSKWQGPVGLTELSRMKADNVAGVWPGAWHGRDANPYVTATLLTAHAIQLKTGTYTIINDRPGAFSVRAAAVAVGEPAWERLRFVAIDVELKFSEGVDGERIILDAAAEIIRQGERPVLYTGNWFWNWWMLSLGHPPDVGGLPVIVAYYNGIPDLTSFPSRPGYGPIVGHQYTGSTQAYGTTVDFNVLDKAWVDAWPPAPTPEPPPPPDSEGDVDMGKILDAAVVAGNAIIRGAELTEAEIAKAMKLPVAPAPTPPPTPTPAPTPPPAPTGTTYTVVGGDQLGTIALKYQSKWPAGMSLWGRDGAVAKLAAHNGIDPDAGLSVGQVLKIPW